MIYTCTFNPAIDLFVQMEKLEPDTVNRTQDEDYQPNGKGINVSIMLQRLGAATTALGFIGGFSGKFIQEELTSMQIPTQFIEIDGVTRINVFANAEQEYKIVNNGPPVPASAVEAMLAQIKQLPPESQLVVSGSLPKNVSDAVYTRIAQICKTKNIQLILDVSSVAVLDCLSYRPYLLKPNEEELAEFFGEDASTLTVDHIVTLGEKLLHMGAEQVIVSRGSEGSLYISKEKVIAVSAPPCEIVNSACSGDALLAAFLGTQQQENSLEQSLIFASAAGTATACAKGLAVIEDIETLTKDIHLHYYKGGKINV